MMMKLGFRILFVLAAIALVCSCEKQDLSSLDDHFIVRQNGADIPAYVYGNASEKVFLVRLHGGPGVSSLPDRSLKIFKDLEEQFAIVHFDQRGAGMSQGNYSKDDHNVWEMAKDVKALALILKYKYGNDSKLFLTGESWGGMLGTAALLDRQTQNLFEGWIEVCGGHDSPARNQGTIDMIKKIGNEQIILGNSVDYWNKTIASLASYDLSDPEDCTNLNGLAFQAQNVLQQDGVMNGFETEIDKGQFMKYAYIDDNIITTSLNNVFSSDDLQKDGKLFTTMSLTDSLYLIDIPCLFLWGKYDCVVTPAIAQTAYDRVSTSDKKIVIFEKSGHNLIAQQPDDYYNAMVEFIDDHK